MREDTWVFDIQYILFNYEEQKLFGRTCYVLLISGYQIFIFGLDIVSSKLLFLISDNKLLIACAMD